MEYLKEMARIVTSLNSNATTFSGEKNGKKDGDTRLDELIKGIIEGKYQTDEDASVSLYNSKEKDTRYRKLKTFAKRKLLNSILLLDLETPGISKGHIRAMKDYVSIWTLAVCGARNTAVNYSEKSLRFCLAMQYYDIAKYHSKYLRGVYGITGNLKQFEVQNDLFKLLNNILQAEDLASEYYNRIIIRYINTTTVQKEISEVSLKYGKELEKLSREFNSYIVEYYSYRLLGFAYDIKFDHLHALNIYKKADKFLENNEIYKTQTRSGEIALKRMHCYMQLRDYDNGNVYAQKCLDLFPPGRYNWYSFIELYFLLSMYTKTYTEAAKIFSMATQNPGFNNLTKDRIQKWKIFEAYIYYTFEHLSFDTGLIKVKKGNKFKLYKFLNEVSQLEKDKEGYNISINIIRILWLLEKNEFDKIIDMAESLKVYRSRYLKDEDHFRSNLFVKMLLIMEKKSFDHDQTKLATAKYYDALINHNQDYEARVTTLEVIPFDELWLLVLEKLKQKDRSTSNSSSEGKRSLIS